MPLEMTAAHSIANLVGNTPLVALNDLNPNSNNRLFAKLEGNNPAGSVKDRPAFHMIQTAEARGDIRPGDTLIEATSGNTGIALALAASVMGYRMILVMPESMTVERRSAMSAYGARLELTPADASMEGAIDRARELEQQGVGKVLDQFSNPDNYQAHVKSTGPEIWHDTEGKVSHFVSAMGTTGTIMGVSRYLKSQNSAVQIIGVQPQEGSCIPGIRRWPREYLPKIYDPARVDRLMDVTQQDAEETTLRLAREEGIFCGISSGGAVAAAMQLSATVEGATIVTIICDRGDRYLSTGIFAG
jgi:S-sulfo-L-cysteine synthase (O-acetyl-L-serine-dependent)